MSKTETIFDYWIIHDDTNSMPNTKKFMTIRPIPRYTRKTPVNFDDIIIGTNGFVSSQWKMFDTIVEYINASFDKVIINMNLSINNFGGGPDTDHVIQVANQCKAKVTKPGVILNMTHTYFPTELDLIEWLEKNTMNIYFYNPPVMGIGVGGSPDLAISAQSSLAVNDSYMLRHIHTRIGSCGKDDIAKFMNNANKVKELYEDWSPDRMTRDYKHMIEKVL
jgi:hypothetical protein